MVLVIDSQSLARIPLLKDVAPEALGTLARSLRRRSYRRGEVIFHQGDPGDTLHLVQEGRVKVVLPSETGDEAVLAILGPGDCFGELALLDGERRSASVVAME